jgi:ketosteroid isomerase-like protein
VNERSPVYGAPVETTAGSLPAVYKRIVSRRVRGAFSALGKGDFAPALEGVADDVHHVFAGDHPLAGERHSAEALERWFQRVFRLFSLDFDVKQVAVAGWPWRTTVAVEWVAHVTPVAGPTYDNRGAHVIGIRWGRIVYIHAYEDSQAVAAAFEKLREAGVEEADATPIT